MLKHRLLITVALAAAFLWSNNPAGAAQRELRLTVLHTNDLHGMLMPHHYKGVPAFSGKDRGGVARVAGLVNRIRQEASNPVLLLDAGDTFTRGPWHTRFLGKPEIDAMNLMGYTAACVGNNEFKALPGPESQQVLRDLVARSRFPWLAANLVDSATDRLIEGIHPFIVLNIDGVRVGIFGVTAPRSNTYPQLAGWKIIDYVETARRTVAELRKQADVVLALTHIGVFYDANLARSVPGIDAIIGGDTHTFLFSPQVVRAPDGRMVPIASAGEQGVALGRLDLHFVRTGYTWRLKGHKGRLIPIDKNIAEDAQVSALIRSYTEQPPGETTESEGTSKATVR